MDIIKLNFRGTLFEIPRQTLFKIPYFKNMFEMCDLKNDIPFINRSAAAFDYIISFAHDPQCKVPTIYEPELKFYTMDYQPSNLHNELSDIHNRLNCIEYDLYRDYIRRSKSKSI